MMRQRGGIWKRILIGAAVVLVVLGIWLGPVIADFAREGFFNKPPEKHQYEGSVRDNLKALHTAMMLHQESEGQFPDADKWMDEIKNRIQTNDLKKGEAEKKFVDPAASPGPGQYGFAMNDAASAKFFDPNHKVKDDFPDPKTVLLFESTDLARNAHGDPAKSARSGGMAITVSGDIVKLP